MTKDIFGGRYTVCSDGTILTNVKFKNPTPLAGKVCNSGYRMVVLTVDGKKIYKNVHRLVAEAFIPNKESKREVNHKNGNKLDNSIENLEWATTQENQIHYRDVLGSKNYKLSIEKAIEIRERYSCEKITHRELALEYGVGKSIIGQILSNKRWCNSGRLPQLPRY